MMDVSVAKSRVLDWIHVGSILAAALCGTGIVGCGGSTRIPVYPVNGQVLHQGEPAKGALVIFHPIDQKKDVGEKIPPRPSAIVRPDGTFSLTTLKPDDGARIGDYRVSIVWFEQADRGEGGLGRGDPEHGPRAKDQLKGKYAHPDNSGLTATIKSGSNNLSPFELN